MKIQQAGGVAKAVAADVTQWADVDRTFTETVNSYSKVDIHANIAGIMHTASVADTTEAMFEETLAANMKCTFLCCKRALPKFEKLGKGKIMNMASISGRIGISDNSAHSAAKAGIAGFTVALAKDLFPKNINVNALGPGGTETRPEPAPLRRLSVSFD